MCRRRCGGSQWCFNPMLSTRICRCAEYVFWSGKHEYAKEDRRLVLSAAKMLQIENLMDRKPGQLSGGQRQRLLSVGPLCESRKSFCLMNPSQFGCGIASSNAR